MKIAAIILSLLAALQPGVSFSSVFTFTDENAYLAKLAQFIAGYATPHEALILDLDHSEVLLMVTPTPSRNASASASEEAHANLGCRGATSARIA